MISHHKTCPKCSSDLCSQGQLLSKILNIMRLILINYMKVMPPLIHSERTDDCFGGVTVEEDSVRMLSPDPHIPKPCKMAN